MDEEIFVIEVGMYFDEQYLFAWDFQESSNNFD